MTPTQAQIEAAVGEKFNCFGGGRTPAYNNPVSIALKDKPLMFAAGVSVAEVVSFVLTAAAEVSHNHVYHGPGGRCIACDLTEAQVTAAAEVDTRFAMPAWVEAEREACARVADEKLKEHDGQYGCGPYTRAAIKSVAAAIRARAHQGT